MGDYYKDRILNQFHDGDHVVVGFDDSAFYERGGIPISNRGEIKQINNQKFVLIEDQLIDPKYIFSLQKVE